MPRYDCFGFANGVTNMNDLSSNAQMPIVLIGGFGSHWADYNSMGKHLARVSGRRVFIANINRLSWVVGGFTDYFLLVDRAHKAVLHALNETGAEKVMLVGHSAGGVVGRAYLADRTPKPHQTAHRGYERVSHLIMIGSPLRVVTEAQHPGTRQASEIDEMFPGAFFAPQVQYLTVGGKFIKGKADGTLREREAYRNYKFVSGRGAQWGDGVVPLSMSRLDGAPHVEIEGMGHSPLWLPWFGGSEDMVNKWWHALVGGDAPLLESGRAFV
jgi:pimeloyl-ACP methyl ester carboxylesterase